MSVDTTIIYYTDNVLDPLVEAIVRANIHTAARGKRIISVSQKPIAFGDNICVGDIGRSHHSLFYQTLVGAEAATTRYIALAEHDCMYLAEHFDWTPPDDTNFWYNVNHWLVQWGGKHSGMYSYFRRKVMSQLICNRELYIRAIKEKLKMLELGAVIRKGQPGACEPGVCDNRAAFVMQKETLYLLPENKDVGKETFAAKAFATSQPNLDIRHGGNFSHGRRARRRRFYLEPWGSFHRVMGQVPPGEWYQNAVIEGVAMPCARSVDTNEKRWRELIEPILPFDEGDGRVFLDLGSNAGFYLRKAADLGYVPVGVESDETYCRHAAYWESCEPKGTKTIYADINTYNFRCASIVLLANVIYWQTPEQVQELMTNLRDKAYYVLVVSRHNSAPEHKSPCDKQYIWELFGGMSMVDWELCGLRDNGKHFSRLYRNRHLVSRDTVELAKKQQFWNSRYFKPAFMRFLDGRGNYYMRYLRSRWPERAERIYKEHRELYNSVNEYGLYEPFKLRADGTLIDGDHRLMIALHMGRSKVICRPAKGVNK